MSAIVMTVGLSEGIIDDTFVIFYIFKYSMPDLGTARIESGNLNCTIMSEQFGRKKKQILKLSLKQ